MRMLARKQEAINGNSEMRAYLINHSQKRIPVGCQAIARFHLLLGR